MRSNGFGSWSQKVIVHVDARHSEEVAKKLRASGPLKRQGKPERAYFEWTRASTSRGDDEDVVFELSMLIGDLPNHYDWNIDWSATEF